MILPDLQALQRVLFTVYTATAWSQLKQQSLQAPGQFITRNDQGTAEYAPDIVDVPSLLYVLLLEFTPAIEPLSVAWMRRLPSARPRAQQLLLSFSGVRGRLPGPTDEDLERAREWVACHSGCLPNYHAYARGDLAVNWSALWWLTLCTTSVYSKLYSPPSEPFMRELAAVVAGHPHDAQPWQPAKPFRRILQ